jgi:hypothetical protein
MTNTEMPSARPVLGKRGVQLEIDAGPQPPERWSVQLDLLRAAGADLDYAAKRWHMILTEDQLTAAVLDKLFYAAREYGARVTVREELAGPPVPEAVPDPPARRTPWWLRWRPRRPAESGVGLGS